MKKLNLNSVAKKIIAVSLSVVLAMMSVVVSAESYTINMNDVTCVNDGTNRCQLQDNKYTLVGKSIIANKKIGYGTFSNPLNGKIVEGFSISFWEWISGWYQPSGIVESTAVSLGDASGSYMTITNYGSVILNGTELIDGDPTKLGHVYAGGNGESWVNILLSCDGDSLKVYVNGGLVGEASLSSDNKTALLSIADTSANATLFGAFGGINPLLNFVQYANVTFYDVALSESEAKAVNYVDLSSDTDLSASPLTMVFGDGATFNATNYTYDAATGAITWNGRTIETAPAEEEPVEDGKLEVSDYIVDGVKTAPVEEGKIFAGWYSDEEYTTPYTEESGRAYAKFVDADILTVKYQLGTGTLNSDKVRLVTSVDTVNYNSIGFIIDGEELNSDEIYETLTGAGNEYAPTVFSEESNYFKTYVVDKFDSTVVVTPFWVTEDGTKVLGTEREITL